MSGYTESVAALFDAGAGLSTSATDGINFMQDVSIIRLFFDHVMDPIATSSNGESILARVSSPIIDFSDLTLNPNRFMADPAYAREFLSRDADPNHTSWIEVLLDHGARLEQEYIFYAFQPHVRQKLQRASFLLAKRLDPNQGTPLHYAVECSSPGLVRRLLDAGADPTVRSTGRRRYGEQPLAVA
ncbi:hypothetical protein F1880_006515 [Penicillium rolfsii]|nr:hypothetical protein F1880_006515 [Penicillium rolfsii]